MEKWLQKPMGFGEILDATFRILKIHFKKLFQISMILVGPLYLLMILATFLADVPLIHTSSVEDISSFWIRSAFFNYDEVLMGYASMDSVPYGILIFTNIVMVLIAVPMVYASIAIFINDLREGTTIQIGKIIKRAFKRYWALLGGLLVYYLIMAGLFIVGFFLISFLAGALGAGMYFSSVDSVIRNVMVMLITMGILLIPTLLGVGYFLIRWSFFFAAIVFEKVSPGLGKSWNLTRKSFWRVFGLFLVVSIITSILTWALEAGTVSLLGDSVLMILLVSLFDLVIMLVFPIAYTIVYFDLRIRNEAEDVKELIESYPVESRG